MNVKKCVNGHFFDADKYAVCPHCGASIGDSGAPAAPVNEERKSGAEVVSMPEKTMGKTFGVFDEPKSNKDSVPAPAPAPAPVHEAAPYIQPTSQNKCPSCSKTIPENAKFCRFCGATIASAKLPDAKGPENVQYTPAPSIPEAPAAAPVSSVSCPKCGNPASEGMMFCRFCGNALKAPEEAAPQEVKPEPVVVATPVQEPAPEPVKKEASSLQDEIRKSVSGSEGKTVGFFSMGGSESKEAPTSDPVVGWLVCIKGKHIGDSFNIVAGKNSIGRGVSNRIVIANDNTVSREKHLWIVYEPKKRLFFVQPGEGSGLSYLNGDIIMETKGMKAKDQLEIGDGKYILIPLCDEDFSWEDYMN